MYLNNRSEGALRQCIGIFAILIGTFNMLVFTANYNNVSRPVLQELGQVAKLMIYPVLVLILLVILLIPRVSKS